MTARHLPPPLMVAAVRHLLSADAWTAEGFFENTQPRTFIRAVHNDDIEVAYQPGPVVTVDRWNDEAQEMREALRISGGSVQQAVDYLVTAGILPPELHSIARQFVPATDYDGTGVQLDPDGTVMFTDGTFDEPADGWEYLYRRVVAS